jgi:PAS domain S-box-containing protein
VCSVRPKRIKLNIFRVPLNKLPVITRFLLYFVVSAFGIFLALGSLDYQKFKLEQTNLKNQELLRLSLTSKALRTDLREPIGDIRTIAAMQVMSDYVNHQTAAHKDRVEKEFLSFARNIRSYDQIRFIDTSGMERVRVDYASNVGKVVPPDQLQDKSDRYYFREGLHLKANEIYISPIDLNIEHGKVERPFKLMIRFVMPAFDSRGQLRGVIVLNYLATTLINDFKQYMSSSWGQAMLVNPAGYWLSSPNRKDEQSFITKSGDTFARRHARAWDYILRQDSGEVKTAAGLFLFDTVQPYAVNPLENPSDNPAAANERTAERFWKVITRVPPTALSYSPMTVFKDRLDELSGLLLMVGVLSTALAWLRTNYVASANALRESEERFRELVDQASDGIFIADLDGRYTDVNSAGCQMLGYGREEIVGKTIADFIPPGELDRLWTEKGKLLQGDIHVSEWTLRHKNGGYLPFEVSAKILPDGRWQAFIRDISKRRKTERQLHQYRERLEEMVVQRTAALEASNKELEAFSYSIAHDLRTPLRSITSFSQILEQEAGAKLTEQECQDLQRIVKAGKYMAQLIDDILQLARISRREFNMEEVNLSKLAESIIDELRDSHPQRSVQVVIEPGIICKCDAQLLGIALRNLLENAWKFTARRDDAYIEFGVTDKGKEKVYFVRDNGAGFDMQYVHKLFTPFGRLHKPGDFEGAGIGLVSVQSAIQRHNGKVWAESKVGEGTTFYFTLHTFQPDGLADSPAKLTVA